MKQNPENTASLIQKGNPMAIVINKVHIGTNNGEFFSSRPMCRFWCDTGEVAVILTLDLGNGEDPKDYFVGFYEGVNNESDLPFYDLLAYATASLDASTIRIKLTVIDMDNYSVFDNKFTNYLRELTPQISKTMPAGSAISDVLISVGSYILKEAQKDDKIMELEFQLYDVPKDSKDKNAPVNYNDTTGIPIIEEKNFAVIRTADSREWTGRNSTGDFYFSKTLDLLYRPRLSKSKEKMKENETKEDSGKKENDRTEPVIDLPYISVTLTKKLPNLDIHTAMNFSNNVRKNIQKAVTQNADVLNLITDLTNLIINKGAEFYRQSFDKNRGNKEAFISLLRFYTDHSEVMDKREKALIFQLFQETVCAESDIGINEFIEPKKDLFHKVSTSALNYVEEKNCGNRTTPQAQSILNSQIFAVSSAAAEESKNKSRWNIVKTGSRENEVTDCTKCQSKYCNCSNTKSGGKNSSDNRSSSNQNQKQNISNNPSFVNEIHIHSSGSAQRSAEGDSIKLSVGTSLFGWNES
ncbi:MAG TPA: hypothetical protein PKA14_26020, partial [Leptospiraceae bacterium]|nr:hypothetical protein [Leptospiraceae bacterium]